MKQIKTFEEMKNAINDERSIFIVKENNDDVLYTCAKLKEKGQSYILTNGFNGLIYLQS